jgi:type VI secretion system protein ImpK
MDALFAAAAPVVVSVARLGVDRDWPPPDDLRRTVLAGLRQMVVRAREAGLADADIAEARYAIVAFVDDRVLRSDWSGRATWTNKPLQLELYREYSAGENFFARLDALLRRSAACTAVPIYALCIALGFQGASSRKRTGKDASAYLERARSQLPRSLQASLSPDAIPSDWRRPRARRQQSTPALTVCGALVVVFVVALLRWSVNSMVDRAERGLRRAAPAAQRMDPS